MTQAAPSLTSVIVAAASHVLTRPSSFVPALVLLLPTLALQLVFPTYLRTRLAPSMWTVVTGGAVLIWLSQAATPAVCALVHARRTGTRWPPLTELARLSLTIGTSVTLGLALAVLPGLWLQARYAFAPLPTLRGVDDSSIVRLRQSAVETRAVRMPLVLMAVLALIASALGQSVVAALAEWMGTVTPVRQIAGHTIFELHYFPHTFTSGMAYAWSAVVLTLYATGVSLLSDSVRGACVPALSNCAEQGIAGRSGSVPAVAAAAGILLALAAVIYKVQQHLY